MLLTCWPEVRCLKVRTHSECFTGSHVQDESSAEAPEKTSEPLLSSIKDGEVIKDVLECHLIRAAFIKKKAA